MEEPSLLSPLSGVVAYPTERRVPASVSALRLRGGGALRELLDRAARHAAAGRAVTVRCRCPAEARRWRSAWEQYSVPGAVAGTTADTTVGAINRPAFGQYTFGETVGLWLPHGRAAAAGLLSPFISTEGFEFTPAEFLDLKERLLTTLRHYGRLPEVSAALEELNTGFFRHQSREDSENFIRDRLEEYLATGAGLHRDYLLTVHGYQRRRLLARQEEWRERYHRLLRWREELRGAAPSRPKAFARAKPLAREWEGYREETGQDLPAYPTFASVDDLSRALTGEIDRMTQRGQNLAREVQEEGLSLSALTADPDLVDPDRLRDLGARLRELIRVIDEAGLYQLPLGGPDAATAPRQLRLLEQLLARLRNTQRHLGEYPDFYARRHLWYQQPARLRRLLAPLLDLPAREGETAFSAWYFERCLRQAWEAAATAPEGQPAPVTPSIPREAASPRFVAGAPPAPRAAAELLVDLTGEEPPAAWRDHPSLSWAPLQDATARHYALAGSRAAARTFTQCFAPLRPPAWAAVRVSEPPPGSDGRLSFQRGDTSAWRPCSAWAREETPHLHLYLPAELTPAETTFLLREWEFLLTAAPRLTFFHARAEERSGRALLSDGFSADFLVAVLLRAAATADTGPFDRAAFRALGRELRTRCGLSLPAPHPLAEVLRDWLADELPGHFSELHVPWRDTFLPLLVTSPTGRKTVLLPDGRLPGGGDARVQARRRRELTAAGFVVHPVSTPRLWRDPEGELTQLRGAVAGAGEG